MTGRRLQPRTALGALLLAALAAGSCGDSEATSSKRCNAAPAAVVKAIEAGLEDGIGLRNVQVVRSRDYEKVYIVAGDLTGPGLSGRGDTAAWATNKTDGTGNVMAVDAVANEFSDWPEGAQTDAGVNATSDGVEAASKCVVAK